MNLLTTFHPRPNVAIIGASGGIGSALVDLLSADEAMHSITAFARSMSEPDFIDITDEDSVARAAELAAANGPLDLVLVATGILHNDEGIQPEKSLRDISRATMEEVFLVNAIGPALVAKHFLPKMRKGAKTVFAALSARVGSISDNYLGGWSSYRASKAALNMLLKTASIEHARRFPDSIVAGLHPGTVDTRLSQPFARNVPANSLFTPEFAAQKLVSVVDGLVASDTGKLFAWDGARIEF